MTHRFGVGTYKTRNGRTAVVTCDINGLPYSLRGQVDDQIVTWTPAGKFWKNSSESDFDLMPPSEPAPPPAEPAMCEHERTLDASMRKEALELAMQWTPFAEGATLIVNATDIYNFLKGTSK